MAVRAGSLFSRLRRTPTIFVPDLSREDRKVLCTHQRWRWLANDNLQRKVRSVEYDIDKLAETVVRAAGASHCVQVTKTEAGNNDVLFLKTDSGKELVARIPYGTAGPPQLCTQSEVATLDFLGNYLGLPVPRVLAWSDSSKEVGTEFIAYEKLPGEPISEFIDGLLSLPSDERAERAGDFISLVNSYVDIEDKLAKVAFSQYGSLFYKEHVSTTLQARPLYAPGVPEDAASQRFRIGPSIDRVFYRGGRARLSIDRGPWTSATDYTRSVIQCEESWIIAYGDTPMGRQHAADEAGVSPFLAALKCWGRARLDFLSEALSPPLDSPILWHPDPHGHNILVSRDPDGTARVSALIDWSGACLQPLYLCLDDPEFIDISPSSLHHLQVPDGGMTLPVVDQDARDAATPEVRRLMDDELFRIMLFVFHRSQLTEKMGKAATVSLAHPMVHALRSVEQCVPYAWNVGLGKLATAIVELESTYGAVTSSPPPLTFDADADERAANAALERMELADRVLVALYYQLAADGVVIKTDGRVEAADLAKATAAVEGFYQRTLAEAPSEEEGARVRAVWPFRDGVWSETAETCV